LKAKKGLDNKYFSSSFQSDQIYLKDLINTGEVQFKKIEVKIKLEEKEVLEKEN